MLSLFFWDIKRQKENLLLFIQSDIFVNSQVFNMGHKL